MRVRHAGTIGEPVRVDAPRATASPRVEPLVARAEGVRGHAEAMTVAGPSGYLGMLPFWLSFQVLLRLAAGLPFGSRGLE